MARQTMNAEPVPFDDLPDYLQEFLLDCFGQAIRGEGVEIVSLGVKYQEPTAATHTLHVLADGSYQYHDKAFRFWG